MSRHFVAFEKTIQDLKDWTGTTCPKRKILLKNYELTIEKYNDFFHLCFLHAAPTAPTTNDSRNTLVKVFKGIPCQESSKYKENKRLQDMRDYWGVGQYLATSYGEFSPGYNDISIGLHSEFFTMQFYLSCDLEKYQKFAMFVYLVLCAVFECLEREDLCADYIFVLQRYFPNDLVRIISCY